MAASNEHDDLVKTFEEFCELGGKDKSKLTVKASGKIASDCFGKIDGVDMLNLVDTVVFPKVKDKKLGYMPVNKETAEHFLEVTAIQHVMRLNPKRKDVSKKDKDVDALINDLRQKVIKGGPKKHKTAISKTGNVDHLTDTSQYTGSSKSRFDESGKGRGKEGRVDIVKSTGYVGAYKDEGTYDKKH